MPQCLTNTCCLTGYKIARICISLQLRDEKKISYLISFWLIMFSYFTSFAVIGQPLSTYRKLPPSSLLSCIVGAANYPAYHLSACGSVCAIWLKLKYHVWTRLHGGVMSFTAYIRHVLKKAGRPGEESRLLSLFRLCKKILCSVSVFLHHICLRHICLRNLPHSCACCMLILTKLLV